MPQAIHLRSGRRQRAYSDYSAVYVSQARRSNDKDKSKQIGLDFKMRVMQGLQIFKFFKCALTILGLRGDYFPRLGDTNFTVLQVMIVCASTGIANEPGGTEEQKALLLPA